MNKRLVKRILQFISGNHAYDCSSSQISKKLKISRVTISKYLKILEASGEISSQSVGMAKLWYRSDNPTLQLLISKKNGMHLKALLNSLPEGIQILDKDLKLYWANSMMKTFFKKNADYKGRCCYEALGINNMAMCSSNCPVLNTFKTGKRFRAITAISKNGNKLYFEMTSSPIKDSSKHVVAVIEQVAPLSEKEFNFKRNSTELLVEV